MVKITGLTGLRPIKEKIAEFTAPPYDVIEQGSDLEALLKGNENSLFHIILGSTPNLALERLVHNRSLQVDNERCFYVYEQTWGSNIRTGVFVAAEISNYSERRIIDHEKVDDVKVEERRKLAEVTGYSFGPVFTLTESNISDVFEKIKRVYKNPEYEFLSDFNRLSDLCGINNKIWRIKTNTYEGSELIERIGQNPLYIADGHHRYKAALLNHQTHFLAYVCEARDAEIQAYNRAIKLNGDIKFDDVKDLLELDEISEFKTPPKGQIYIYADGKTYSWDVDGVPPDTEDIVGKLDVSILEGTFFKLLGNKLHIDPYPESQLDKMKSLVDSRTYDIAFALNPVSFEEELKPIADAGLRMPSKSTYCYPKILSGIFMMRNNPL